MKITEFRIWCQLHFIYIWFLSCFIPFSWSLIVPYCQFTLELQLLLEDYILQVCIHSLHSIYLFSHWFVHPFLFCFFMYSFVLSIYFIQLFQSLILFFVCSFAHLFICHFFCSFASFLVCSFVGLVVYLFISVERGGRGNICPGARAQKVGPQNF